MGAQSPLLPVGPSAFSGDATTTVVIMSESGTVEEDPLRGLDPRRRAALERIRREFKEAGGDRVSLSDELIAERRLEAAAEDGTSTGRE